MSRTVSQSSSLRRMNSMSRVTPALLTRMSTPPSAASAAGTSFSVSPCRRDCGQHVGLAADIGGERLQRLAPRAGRRPARPTYQCAGDIPADTSARAGHERRLARQIEHSLSSLTRMRGMQELFLGTRLARISEIARPWPRPPFRARVEGDLGAQRRRRGSGRGLSRVRRRRDRRRDLPAFQRKCLTPPGRCASAGR